MNSRATDYFKGLEDHLRTWELASDDLIFQDVSHVINDDKFFIFEEVICQSALLFFRDPYILENMRAKPHVPIVGIAGTDRVIGAYPPCGVLPCKEFARFTAPFCYISDKIEEVYFIFREFYVRYICQIHSINGNNQGILGLCKFFEDLLLIYEPEVCYHLNQLGINPLKVAFPWIFYSFIGYLEVD